MILIAIAIATESFTEDLLIDIDFPLDFFTFLLKIYFSFDKSQKAKMTIKLSAETSACEQIIILKSSK